MACVQLLQIIFICIPMLTTLQAISTPNADKNDQLDTSLLLQQIVHRVDDLGTRDKVQEQLIVDLKKDLADYKQKVEGLQADISEQTGLISSLLSNITRYQAKDYAGKTDIGNTVKRSRRELGSYNVAFTAGLSRSILHLPAYHNIVFDHVETNIGNGYNSVTGIFTAPVPGTYMFFTSILVHNGREIFCRIVVNGVNVADTYGRGTDNRLDQGSQAVIVQLQKGHEVAVQNKVDDDAIFGNQDIYTTFSGFLLHSNTFSG